uniref:Uncharacterized protein n=1 Tax=Pararge aegeria TaxID=116150 RepID=S4PRZ8_9NEOP
MLILLRARVHLFGIRIVYDCGLYAVQRTYSCRCHYISNNCFTKVHTSMSLHYVLRVRLTLACEDSKF